jgi:hypothetical protein
LLDWVASVRLRVAAGQRKLRLSAPALPFSQEQNMAKRELINTSTDKRFVRRAEDGTFKEFDDVGRSLAADRRKKAKTPAKSGQGDKGDRKTSAKKTTSRKR